jgi:hypothetical protein
MLFYCTFVHLVSEICPLVSIICNIPAYIHIFTCSEFLSTILIITNEWSSEADKNVNIDFVFSSADRSVVLQ